MRSNQQKGLTSSSSWQTISAGATWMPTSLRGSLTTLLIWTWWLRKDWSEKCWEWSDFMFVFIHNNTSSFFFLTGWQTFTPRPRRALRRVRPSWQAATASETGWPITLRWSLWRDYLCLKSPSPSCCRRKVITQLWSGNGTWDTMVHTGQPREVKCVLSESDNIYQTPTIALKHKSLNMKTF